MAQGTHDFPVERLALARVVDDAADPTAEHRELRAEILSSSALRRIVEYLSYARDLGFDPREPAIMRRAITAGEAAAAVDDERRTAATSYEPLRLGQPGWQVVYYARRASLVKIGTSRNVLGRIKQISPAPDGVVVVEPGTSEREFERHREFADLRESGEWFRLEPALASHIASLRERFERQVGITVEAWLERQPSQRVAAGSQCTTNAQSLLPATEAAVAVGVSRQLLNAWRGSGKLAPARILPSGAKLYRLGDVVTASRMAAASPQSNRHGALASDTPGTGA